MLARLAAGRAGTASGWIAPALLLALWQAGSSLGYAVAETVLPSPASVVAAAWRLTRSGELPRNIGISFLRAAAGLVVGGGIGFAFGLANGLSDLSEASPTRRCRWSATFRTSH